MCICEVCKVAVKTRSKSGSMPVLSAKPSAGYMELTGSLGGIRNVSVYGVQGGGDLLGIYCTVWTWRFWGAWVGWMGD